jgi:hypothetical protein
LNTFVISLLKLYNSLEENVHILNKTSQNINNTKKINVNEKTYSYSEDKNKLSGNIIKKFTKMMKTTSKDKHIVKHNFFSRHCKTCLLFLSKNMFYVPNLILD